MADTATLARPIELVGTAGDVARRITFVRLSALSSSAQACADDAERALVAHKLGDDFPGVSTSPLLPQSWLESALAWCHRAGQHEFGFALPEGW
jgi:hypothetical protein